MPKPPTILPILLIIFTQQNSAEWIDALYKVPQGRVEQFKHRFLKTRADNLLTFVKVSQLSREFIQKSESTSKVAHFVVEFTIKANLTHRIFSNCQIPRHGICSDVIKS